MRPANRGDVPAPHVPTGAGKPEVTGGSEVIFDSGSLSFVKDWVEGADDTAGTSGVEPARSDPRPTKSTRRLGVGAKPKHPKRDQPEPSALQKKLTRKRQRQELADAIVGQASTHGVAEDDGESEEESKTASFKEKKKESQTTMSVDQRCKAEKGKTSNQDKGDDKNIWKPKARRKKGKAKEADGEADVAGEEPQTAAENVSTPEEQPPIVERDQIGDKTEAPDQETRKQRRGWGKKGPSNPSEVSQDSEPKSRLEGNIVYNGNTEEGRLKRKKKRSRQKNIRKDKRPLDQRPAHLRVGDPEFSGRTLTSETRKVLGLPADEIDANF